MYENNNMACSSNYEKCNIKLPHKALTRGEGCLRQAELRQEGAMSCWAPSLPIAKFALRCFWLKVRRHQQFGD